MIILILLQYFCDISKQQLITMVHYRRIVGIYLLIESLCTYNLFGIFNKDNLKVHQVIFN